MKDIAEQWVKLSRKLSRIEPRLAPIIKQVGPPKIEFRRDPFPALSRIILSQQLATGAARAIIGRYAALAEPFPTAEDVLRFPLETMRGAGLSRSKSLYLKALAEKWLDGTWREGWASLDDEALTARITEVKGLGVWSAHMYLIFTLGRVDILPVGDFGVRKGVQLLLKLKEMPTPREMPELVAHWEGMRSVASWYLWRALDGKMLPPAVTPPKARRPPRPRRKSGR